MSGRNQMNGGPPERVKIVLEEPEDMWHAHNLIVPGDQVTGYGSHRVSTETSTGSSVSSRVYTKFTISVKKIDFDPGASELHLSGQIVRENSFAKLGQHQTLHLKVSDQLTLEKTEGWDSVSLETLRELTDPRKRADKSNVIAAVVMQDGLANICAITEHRTVLKQRVSTAIPKKRGGSGLAHDERLKRFFEQILTSLLRHANLESEQPILLASPGFTASAFLAYVLSDKGVETSGVKDLKSKFVVAHSSTGHLHALYEVMKSPEVQGRLQTTRLTREIKLMDHFMELLRKDEGWAWYGPGEVTKAVERGAVGKGGGKLLISQSLFRAQDVAVRKRYVQLVESTKEFGGEVTIFSDANEGGKRLESLSGVAAILTYPLPDLDEDEAENGGEDEGEENEGVNGTNAM
ncbi:MAG: hypothetical protein M1823_003329 [Watsoniomyces obsoletus]|nr:MAG: hypothetical protein M1823_003329 [Watsoniomyces obsoletus]